MTDRLGTDTAHVGRAEVGDGNLNLVFIVTSPIGALIVKQALPYLRVVGEGWPLPLRRTFFEYNALDPPCRARPRPRAGGLPFRRGAGADRDALPHART